MNDIEPWYKQFWPWFLIAVPAITVVICAMLIFTAIDTKDSIVVDDYYKKGKAINLELSKIKRAQELNITLLVSSTRDQLNVVFATGKPNKPLALSGNFYHPTLSEKDFSVNFTADANGDYSAHLPANLNGKWRLTIMPFDNSWKLQSVIAIPTSEMLIEP